MTINKMITRVIATGYKKYRNLGVENIINYADEVDFKFQADSKTAEEDVDDLVINYIVDKFGI